ncbi:Lmo0850 family protein [Domibacillus robiginosus]|uniref:Lmo0850 family protein n=1 Tax=Domibacillus robiginosus TaxID=1071054 RepID=UPI000A723075|nr:Lmo0850 family protein [Domibacillus robiginosus]
MKSTDRTRQIVDNLARLGVKATVTKSRAALWSALQCGEAKVPLKAVTSCHTG